MTKIILYSFWDTVYSVYTMNQKTTTQTFLHISLIIDRFKKIFTVTFSGKFAIKWSFKLTRPTKPKTRYTTL